MRGEPPALLLLFGGQLAQGGRRPGQTQKQTMHSTTPPVTEPGIVTTDCSMCRGRGPITYMEPTVCSRLEAVSWSDGEQPVASVRSSAIDLACAHQTTGWGNDSVTHEKQHVLETG